MQKGVLQKEEELQYDEKIMTWCTAQCKWNY